jgi:hypothetical protein
MVSVYCIFCKKTFPSVEEWKSHLYPTTVMGQKQVRSGELFVTCPENPHRELKLKK